MFAGRRNGAAPTSGPYAPIGTVGNAGLMAGASALLANDFVTTAWRYVYEPTKRSIEPTLASADISRPRAQYEEEFTYPDPDPDPVEEELEEAEPPRPSAQARPSGLSSKVGSVIA